MILGVQNPLVARTVNTSPLLNDATGKVILKGPLPVPGKVKPVNVPFLTIS
jgi:hypothetical protein